MLIFIFSALIGYAIGLLHGTALEAYLSVRRRLMDAARLGQLGLTKQGARDRARVLPTAVGTKDGWYLPDRAARLDAHAAAYAGARDTAGGN